MGMDLHGRQGYFRWQQIAWYDVVTARDAKHLADALERALSASRGSPPLTVREARKAAEKGSVPVLKQPGGRRVLREFIAYCRGGRFEVW